MSSGNTNSGVNNATTTNSTISIPTTTNIVSKPTPVKCFLWVKFQTLATKDVILFYNI